MAKGNDVRAHKCTKSVLSLDQFTVVLEAKEVNGECQTQYEVFRLAFHTESKVRAYPSAM